MMKTEIMTTMTPIEDDIAESALHEMAKPLARSSTVSGSRFAQIKTTSSDLRRSFSTRSIATNGSLHLLEGNTHLFPIQFGHESRAELSQRQKWESLFDPHHSFRLINRNTHHHPRLGYANTTLDGLRYRLEEDEVDLEEPTLPPQNLLSEPCDPTAMPVAPCDERVLKSRLELLNLVCNQDIREPSTKKGAFLIDDAPTKATTRSSFSSTRWPRSSKSAQVDLEVLEEANEKGCANDQRMSNSLLFFILGFLFPPIWIIGALYVPPAQHLRSSACQRADRLWRRRSRIAFGFAVIILMLILVLVLVLKPGSLGWRQTKDKPSQLYVPVRPTISEPPASPPPLPA